MPKRNSMNPEIVRKSIWVVTETGKCVCSAVGVIPDGERLKIIGESK